MLFLDLFNSSHTLFLVNISNLFSSAVFIGLIGIIFTILEKSNVNDKKSHFIIGVAIIIFGIILTS